MTLASERCSAALRSSVSDAIEFVRNVLIAIGNSAECSLRPVAARLTTDPNPVVADAARWAYDRLGKLVLR